MSNLLVEVYARKDCGECPVAQDDSCTLCTDVTSTINRINEEIPFEFKEVDITSSDELLRRYQEDIPTIFLNGKKVFKFKVDESEFRKKARKEIIKAGIMKLRNKKTRHTT